MRNAKMPFVDEGHCITKAQQAFVSIHGDIPCNLAPIKNTWRPKMYHRPTDSIIISTIRTPIGRLVVVLYLFSFYICIHHQGRGSYPQITLPSLHLYLVPGLFLQLGQ